MVSKISSTGISNDICAKAFCARKNEGFTTILEDMTVKQVLMVLEIVAAAIAIYEKVAASDSEKA